MITQLQSLSHKEGVDSNDWNKVKNNLVLLALAVAFFCSKRGLPLVFTSIIREGIKGVSISKTHIEGRAFDISVKGWTHKDIVDLVSWVNSIFNIGAVSLSNGMENEVIYEPREYWENGDLKKEAHLHFQTGKGKDGFTV